MSNKGDYFIDKITLLWGDRAATSPMYLCSVVRRALVLARDRVHCVIPGTIDVALGKIP